MKKVLLLTLFTCIFISPVNAAQQYTITAEQLTNDLQTRFPITRQYDDVEAIFFQPVVVIKNLDDEIEIKVKITVNYQNQHLSAVGLIKGEVDMQEVTNTLRLANPELNEFFVDKDDMTDSSPAIKVVKQSIGPSLPPIILLNFEHIELNLLSNEPLKFSLSPQGLILEY